MNKKFKSSYNQMTNLIQQMVGKSASVIDKVITQSLKYSHLNYFWWSFIF